MEVFWVRNAFEGILKFIWDSKHGESIWLVISPRINFIFNILFRSARVGRSSALVILVYNRELNGECLIKI